MIKRSLATLVFFRFLLANQVVAATITLAADEWPPFNNKPNSQNEGYLVDIARQVFAERGFTVEYITVPWKRAVEMTRVGQFNGAIGASKTDAAGFVFPAEEMARNTLTFYVRKGFAWRFTGPQSIEQIRLGTIAGYDYRQWLLEYIAKHQDNANRVQVLHGEDALQRNLVKLLDGRIDVVVDTEAAIRYVAKEMGVLSQISCAGYGQEAAYIYIAFSPSIPESEKYAEILSAGIRELRRSGKLFAILDKYGLTDWQN